MKKTSVKYICMIGAFLLASVLSGCSFRDENRLFKIGAEDLQDGYFGYMIGFEEEGDCVYELTYPLSVTFSGKENDGKVYLFDQSLGSSNVLDYLTTVEPALAGSGELEVISGQWIYITAGDDFKGKITAGYSENAESRKDVSAIFKFLEKGHADVYFTYPYPPEYRLTGYELADITGDGVLDVCTSQMVGSGMVRTICEVYDAEEDELYVLDGYNYSYFVLGIDDGQLSVLEVGPYGYNDPLTETPGIAVLEDDLLVFVPDEDFVAKEDEEPVAEVETSPFVLWEYEGYVDECAGYSWRSEFINCDYDGDGKKDRVNRTCFSEEELAFYTIEFGNGDRLCVPKSWNTGFPHVSSGDLDGDGVNEILFSLSYDTSTDPLSFGEIWLFDKDDVTGEYAEVKLPLDYIERGGKGFEILYDAPDEDNIVHYEIPEYGFSADAGLSHDYITWWWTEEATTRLGIIYYAEIVEDEGTVLRCSIAPFPREGYVISFDITYNDGVYEVGEIEEVTF